MNQNINLCEILKGHEDETFYSPVFGIVILKEIINDYLCLKSVDKIIKMYRDGKYDIHGECMLFPSKTQRNWDKWIEEQKHKVPKTWKNILNNRKKYLFDNYTDYCVDITGNSCKGYIRRNSPIEKSALALLKIHQLIEVGYGGNITNTECNNRNTKYAIVYNCDKRNKFNIEVFCNTRQFIAFHTIKQAEEFISYPENIQLLENYFMIN